MKYCSYVVVLVLWSVLCAWQAGRAESVIEETFDRPLAQEKWKMYPKDKVTATEGTLTLHAEGKDADYVVVAAYFTSAPDTLNFFKNTVEIKLSDLSIQGSADPARRIFILALSLDKPDDDKAISQLRLRIDAAGNLALTVQNKGESAPILSGGFPVSLPIKNLKLTIQATGAALSVVDEKGAREKEFQFLQSPTLWERSAPYFRIQSQRNPGTGSSEVILGGISVDSTPASNSK